jgi:hypothetical protein
LDISDEKFNSYLRKAIRAINSRRLDEFLMQSAEKTAIKVNEQLAGKLGININSSKFSDFIKPMKK